MARPQKDKLEARSAHLPPVRLTEAELAQVVELAAGAGISVSEYARQRIFTGRVKPRPALIDAQLLSDLNRCGVNLNQIARALNSGAGLPTSADETLAAFRGVLERVARNYGS
jgi:hypothetical protein